MEHSYSITAVTDDGSVQLCEVTAEAGRPLCRIVLRGTGIGRIETSETDLFKALQSIRIELDRVGVRLCCNGARRDAYPSGMGRDMGMGLKAYIIQMGRHTQAGDLVNIFEPAPLHTIGTVEEQIQYYQAWLATPRN